MSSKPWREEARKLPNDRSGQDITVTVPSEGMCTWGRKCVRRCTKLHKPGHDHKMYPKIPNVSTPCHPGKCWPED